MGAENTSSFPFLFIPLTPDMTLFSYTRSFTVNPLGVTDLMCFLKKIVVKYLSWNDIPFGNMSGVLTVFEMNVKLTMAGTSKGYSINIRAIQLFQAINKLQFSHDPNSLPDNASPHILSREILPYQLKET